MELFKLFGSILIDNDKANASIAKTEGHAEGLANKFGDGIKTAAKWGAAIAAGAVAAGAGLFAITKKAAETADTIDEMSQKLGLSRKGYQEWSFVLKENGMEIEQLKGGMKKLTNSFDDLKSGSKTATESFKRIGLSYEDLKGLTQEQIFDKTITALQGVKDSTERAALANDLLGKSGAELAPILNAGAGSIDQLKQKARDLGIVLDDEAIDAGAKFADTMEEVNESFNAVVARIGIKVMPMFQKALDWVLLHMPEIQSTAEQVFTVIGDVVEDVAKFFKDNIMPILGDFYDWISQNGPNIKQRFSELFNGIKEVAKPVVDTVSEFVGWCLRTPGAIEGIVIALGALKGAFALYKIAAGLMAAENGALAASFGIAGVTSGVSLVASIALVAAGLAGLIALFGLVAYAYTQKVKPVMEAINDRSLTQASLEKLYSDTSSNFKNAKYGGYNSEAEQLAARYGGHFDVGTRYLPKDAIIQAHEGEMIVPKSENPYANSDGSILPQSGDIVIPIYIEGKYQYTATVTSQQIAAAKLQRAAFVGA